MSTLEKLTAQFNNPDNIYRPLQIIHCHYPKQPEKMDEFLDRAAEKGMGGFVVNTEASPGTPKEQIYDKYLTDEADWKALRTFIEKCYERGLKVWLYDERGFPSGAAGKWTYEQDHDFHVRGATCPHVRTTGGKGSFTVDGGKRNLDALRQEFTEEQINTLNSLDLKIKIHSAAAYPRISDEEISVLGKIDLEVKDNVVSWDLPEGDWIVCAFVTKKLNYLVHAGVPFVDLLRDDVVKAFINCTHDSYVKYLGEENVSKLEAIFTDEPSVACHGCGYHFYEPYAVVAWTDTFEQEFVRTYGYDITKNFDCIFFDTDTDYKRVRRDYWKLVARTYERTFFKQIYDWCEKHGLESTGHMYGEETLSMQIALNADLFGLMCYMQMPGVDRLHSVNPRDVIPEKTASSAAHLMGHKRTMSESSFHFANSFWHLPYDISDMFNTGTYQYMLGINNIASYYGYDQFPPHERKAWEIYMGRLAAFLSEGKHVAPVLMHIPMTGAWERYIPRDHKIWFVGPSHVAPFSSEAVKRLEYAYGEAQLRLLDSQWDYDLIDDRGLLQCNAENGIISTRFEKFETLVIFDSGYIDPDAYNSIKRLLDGGITLLVCRFESGMSEQVRELVDEYPSQIKFTNIDSIVSDVSELCEKPIDVDGTHPKLWVRHNVIDDTHVLAVYNRALEDDKVTIKTILSGELTVFYPESGNIEKVKPSKSGKIKLTVPKKSGILITGEVK